MANTVFITIMFTVKPEKIDELSEALAAAFKETRQYPGCISIRADRHVEDSRILLVEEWESIAKYQEYLAWRVSRGQRPDTLDPYLSAPPVLEMWSPKIG